MRRYRIGYFLGQAFRGLWRNGLMTVASVTVLMSCLVVMGSFALLILNINTNLENLGLLNEIVVFVDESKTDEEVAIIEEKIRALDNVAEVVFISKEEALLQESEQYSEYAGLYDMLAEDNPLRDEFRIKYEDNSVVATLVYQLGQIDGIAKINNRLDLAVSIEKVKSSITLVLVWFMAILLAVSIFVIINTIKLAVYARRHEITVMRYVGATNGFITIPFVFEGIIIGVAASAVAYAIELVIYNYIAKSAFSSVAFISIIDAPTVAVPLFFGFIGVGMLTGIIGSVASLRKYLKS